MLMGIWEGEDTFKKSGIEHDGSVASKSVL